MNTTTTKTILILMIAIFPPGLFVAIGWLTWITPVSDIVLAASFGWLASWLWMVMLLEYARRWYERKEAEQEAAQETGPKRFEFDPGKFHTMEVDFGTEPVFPAWLAEALDPAVGNDDDDETVEIDHAQDWVRRGFAAAQWRPADTEEDTTPTAFDGYLTELFSDEDED